jgi:xylulose-5-phosphate/fructose-6-phosphate phosphoketolase
MVANAYLEGTYSEVYPTSRATPRACAAVPPVLVPGRHPEPRRARDAGLDPRGRRARLLALARLRRRVRQPRPARRCVVGDGEAETGPLATSWHSNKFLTRSRDGAVLPILHLNGYKIANPTVLARIPEDELTALLEGYGYRAVLRRGRRPRERCTSRWPRRSTTCSTRSRDPARARARGDRTARPRWPMIVLRTPRAGPAQGGRRPPGRGHVARAPGAARRGAENPSTWRSSRSGCAATARGAVRRGRRARRPSWPRCRPKGDRRMSANPHANGGLLLRDLALPDFRDYASRCRSPAGRRRTSEATRVLGRSCAT